MVRSCRSIQREGGVFTSFVAGRDLSLTSILAVVAVKFTIIVGRRLYLTSIDQCQRPFLALSGRVGSCKWE